MPRSPESIEKRRIANRKWQKENKDRRAKYNKQWLSENPEKKSLYNTRNLNKNMSAFENGKQRAKEKRCSICKEVKSADQFYLSNTNPDGLHGWCKDCSDKRTTENYRHRVYGVNPEEYQEMFSKQNGRCAICGNKPIGKKSLCVDHNHESGVVRSLLCSRCNLLIGKANDSIEIFKSAITYLERWHK